MLDVPILHSQSESYDGSVHSSFMSIICLTASMQYKLVLLVFARESAQLTWQLFDFIMGNHQWCLHLTINNLFLSQCNTAFLYTANLLWPSELLSLCISAFTCLACLIFTALKGNILWCLLCLTLNIPSLARQRCLPSWGPWRIPRFFCNFSTV